VLKGMRARIKKETTRAALPRKGTIKKKSPSSLRRRLTGAKKWAHPERAIFLHEERTRFPQGADHAGKDMHIVARVGELPDHYFRSAARLVPGPGAKRKIRGGHEEGKAVVNGGMWITGRTHGGRKFKRSCALLGCSVFRGLHHGRRLKVKVST